jgi:putative hemin transport protein
VTRLEPRWAELLAALPNLGKCMALTRNGSAVHEKKGQYAPAEINGHVGLVLTKAIDLRLFLSRWHLSFAVVEEVRGQMRRSFHVFDKDGTAVHKVYAEDPAFSAEFDRVVKQLAAADQTPVQSVQPTPPAPADRPDNAVDAAALRTDWLAMKDTHEFFGLLQKHKVGRTQALRLAGNDLATSVDPQKFPDMLNHAAATSLSIMVFVSSAGVVQIHTGPVQTIKAMGPWINVLDPDFNLHVRQDQVASAWVVRKPTADGIVTSLELFDAKGENIALIFGERKPGVKESEAWRAAVQQVCGVAS